MFVAVDFIGWIDAIAPPAASVAVVWLGYRYASRQLTREQKIARTAANEQWAREFEARQREWALNRRQESARLKYQIDRSLLVDVLAKADAIAWAGAAALSAAERGEWGRVVDTQHEAGRELSLMRSAGYTVRLAVPTDLKDIAESLLAGGRELVDAIALSLDDEGNVTDESKQRLQGMRGETWVGPRDEHPMARFFRARQRFEEAARVYLDGLTSQD